ncbi:MAG: Glu-tRNA(Gln) amidotransferase GatDE subunit E, partial [Bacteroidetes bacterium]|nr:Glu-tRNA(Gln) amidotransferase GatDE subunit E [Bacteroidota bacterium]
GEVHITRKQYLDGSIPTGFQRSAILGVEGYIQLKKKRVRLIQLSIEEDSCREISDVGHKRLYKTDRLGMPLIETVTYPDMETPDELAEAAEYIRFLNRSSGLVRTGMGAAREDVNVSCEGGSRVEIKGVARNSWIPELSHNEAFRQYALLNIRSLLQSRVPDHSGWQIKSKEIGYTDTSLHSQPVRDAFDNGFRVIAINLPLCHGILSHFTQPGKIFADELSDRLKVIACIEKPNMTHSEEPEPRQGAPDFKAVSRFLDAGKDDAQVVLWGPGEDIPTAVETIEERMKLAFESVPNETRKSFADGTTMFERVLPGRDRMYPDTDSPPIPLTDDNIAELSKDLPVEIAERFRQMEKWGIPSDTHRYLLSRNLVEMTEKIAVDFGFSHKFTGCFLGHTLRNLEGKRQPHKNFSYKKIYGLFGFLATKKLDPALAKTMLPVIYDNPDMEFVSVLSSTGFKKKSTDELLAPVDFLYEKFLEIRISERDTAVTDWLMGQIRRQAVGNISLANLSERINKKISNGF